jgi:hypothetical protein
MALDFQAIINFAETLEKIQADIQTLINTIARFPDWVSIDSIKVSTGLTRSAIQKQLRSGQFEEGKDFKQFGKRLFVAKSIIWEIRRKTKGAR